MGADAQLLMSFAGKYAVLDIIAVFFAQYIQYIILVVFAAALLLQSDVRRRIYGLAFTTISLILSWGVIKAAINYAFYRPRPFVAYNITPLFPHEADSSFPSGHATIFFTIATLVTLIFGRRWGMWAFIMAALIGLARVYVGVHYPLDIIAGALIGILSPLIIRLILSPRLVTSVEQVPTTPSELPTE
jgi:undecaprenyl-diphosphatase